MSSRNFFTPGDASDPGNVMYANVSGYASAWPQCCGAGIIDSIKGQRVQKIDVNRKMHDSGANLGKVYKDKWDYALTGLSLDKIDRNATIHDVRDATSFGGWMAVPTEIAIAYLLEKMVLKAKRRPVDGPFYGGETFAVKIWGLIDSYSGGEKYEETADLSFRVNNLISFIIGEGRDLFKHVSYVEGMPSSYGRHYLRSATVSPDVDKLTKWVNDRRIMLLGHVSDVKRYIEKNNIGSSKAVSAATQKLTTYWS